MYTIDTVVLDTDLPGRSIHCARDTSKLPCASSLLFTGFLTEFAHKRGVSTAFVAHLKHNLRIGGSHRRQLVFDKIPSGRDDVTAQYHLRCSCNVPHAARAPTAFAEGDIELAKLADVATVPRGSSHGKSVMG
jgi:hypothetical protein